MPRRFLLPRSPGYLGFTRLFTALIGFCGGIVLAEFWHVPIIVLGSIAGTTGILLSWHKLRVAALIFLAGALGMFRLTTAIAPPDTSVGRFDGQQIKIVGQIFELPETGDRQVVLLDDISVSGQDVEGKVQVYMPSWPKFRPGQELSVNCKLLAVTFERYPRQWSHGVQARCFSAEVVKVRAGPASWRSWLGQALSLVVQRIDKNFNQPQSSLLAGILLGRQSAMSDELRQAFQATGTTHIVALSGFNVTIIITAVIQLLIRIVGRRLAWLPGLGVVAAFVIMTGAAASIVRAAIMAVVTQLGLFMGRPIAPGRLLCYAAIAMLLDNPMILVHDLGFQLSFLATVGLVFFSQPVASRLPFVPETFGLREGLSTTLSAILTTQPLLLWRFGRLSLIAPLVNVLVLPLIPIIMGMGALWLLGQFVHPVIGMIVQPITDALLRTALWLISSGASSPMAQVHLGGWVAGVTAAASMAIIIQVRKNYAPLDISETKSSK